jgi:hypothetical protein
MGMSFNALSLKEKYISFEKFPYKLSKFLNLDKVKGRGILGSQ